MHAQAADTFTQATDVRVQAADIDVKPADVHAHAADMHDQPADIHTQVVDMQAHAADIHSQAADIDDTDMHAQAANMRALAVLDRHKARLHIYTPWHYGKTSRCSSHRSRQLWGIWGWFVVDPGELIPEDTSGRHPGHHKVLKEPQAGSRLTSM